MIAAVEAGADVVEIGVPYTDPGMDGPVIQEAVDVAVRAGVGMRDVLAAPSRRSPTAGAVPVVMSYWNPIERYGVRAVRHRPGRRRGSGGHHPRPHPRRGGRVARRRRARPTWTGSSWSRRPPPTPGCARRRGRLPRLRLRRLHHGRHRHPGHRRRHRRDPGRPHPRGRARTSRSASGLGVSRRRPGRRGRRASPTASSSARPTSASCSTGRGADGVRALTADLAAGGAPPVTGTLSRAARRHPQPDAGRLGARPVAAAGLRAVHHRRHRRRPPGSPRGAGWPAAVRPATCSTSRSGRCPSASSAGGSTT